LGASQFAKGLPEVAMIEIIGWIVALLVAAFLIYTLIFPERL
jgi:hypothetical protein